MHAIWLEGQLKGVQPRTASGWTNAFCPGHNDGDRPSFGFRAGSDGQAIAYKCLAGCSLAQIAAGLGVTVDALRPHPTKVSRRVEATYSYHDEAGQLLFQVVRFANKQLRYRKPDPQARGGWTWSAQGVRHVIYRLHELQGQVRAFVTEGEKDADITALLDLPSTTNPGGAIGWHEEYTQQLKQAGAQQVVILLDNDQAGDDRGWRVARSCLGQGLQAKRLLLPDLPPKGDISDWITAGHTREELLALVDATPWVTAADLPAEDEQDHVAQGLDPRLVEPFRALAALPEYPDHHLLAGPLDAVAGVLITLTDATTTELAFQEAYLRLRVLKIKDDVARKLIKAAMTKARTTLGPTGQPDLDPAELERQLEEAREQAAPVLYAEDPLEEIGKAIHHAGWGGTVKPLTLLYLNMVTRVLPRRRGTLTGHTQVNGAPGSGKSFGLECVLAVQPHDCYEIYDAGSPKVMIYDPASYKHKIVVYREADSLPGVARGDEDNPAASMLRTLLQEGAASYKVPIKDPLTGLFTIQEIKKEGPTVLVVTMVDRLRAEQLDSRLFALDIPEEKDQKQQALTAQSEAELQGSYPEPNPAVLAFGRFLQLAAPTPVVVPFVRAFNALLGQRRVDARLLRDAARILSLIKAVTIVRQTKRDRDDQGRLVATYADYQTVADLVTEVYDSTVTGITPKMRQLVQVVADAKVPLSVTKLAAALGIAKSSCHKRLKVPLANRWLLNTEHRDGYEHQLVIGDPLPHQAGLPSVEELRTWRLRTPVRG